MLAGTTSNTGNDSDCSAAAWSAPLPAGVSSPPSTFVSLTFFRAFVICMKSASRIGERLRWVLRTELTRSSRDCPVLNIMMDADPLYPKGFHPASTVLDASGTRVTHPRRRRDAGGVRYYFIDFGVSTHFEGPGPHRVTGVVCRDPTPPELSRTIPYDPFKLDVYLLGNHFLQEYVNVRPLLAAL